MRFLLRILLPGLLAGSLGSFSGCETVEFASDGLDTTANDTTGKGGDTVGVARLALTNFVDPGPGPMILLLFNPETQDIETTTPALVVDTIDTLATHANPVPAGRWKIGYELNGRRHAMPADSLEGVDQPWPVVALYHERKYWVTIRTHEETDGRKWIWMGAESGYLRPDLVK